MPFPVGTSSSLFSLILNSQKQSPSLREREREPTIWLLNLSHSISDSTKDPEAPIMPSGAKKRKAAKKKKESGAHTHHPPGPGIDEVKTQDSDGSGLSSPVSQDRDNQQSPFGEDLEKRDPFTSESKSMEGATRNGEEGLEKVIVEGEGVVEVVRELDSDGDAEGKIISIENVQSSKGSLDNDGSSSSSDSSDDESRVDEKKEKEEASNSVAEEPSFAVLVSEQVIQLIEEASVVEVSNLHHKDETSSSSNLSDDESRVNEKKEACNSVVEEPSFADLVPEQVNQLIEEASAVEVSDLHHKDVTSSSSNLSDDESRVNEKKMTEEACNSVVEEPSFSTDLAPKGVSQPREEAAVEEVFSPVLGNAPDSDTVEPVVSVSEEVIHVKECVSIQKSVASELAVPVLKENGEKLLPKSDGLTGAPSTETDSESKNVENKSLPILNKNGEASSDVVKSAPEESAGKVLSSSRAPPGYETGNGTEHAKSSEIPQNPENEHRLPVVAPRPVQTTSWKGCCGLFEVLTGSSR